MARVNEFLQERGTDIGDTFIGYRVQILLKTPLIYLLTIFRCIYLILYLFSEFADRDGIAVDIVRIEVIFRQGIHCFLARGVIA